MQGVDCLFVASVVQPSQGRVKGGTGCEALEEEEASVSRLFFLEQLLAFFAVHARDRRVDSKQALKALIA